MELILLAVMFIAAGAVAFGALRKAVLGEISPSRCPECGAVVGRGYSTCRQCGACL